MAVGPLERLARQLATTRSRLSRALENGEAAPVEHQLPADADKHIETSPAEAGTDGTKIVEVEAVKVGRYEVIERVGAGGMGVVWKAFDPELNRGVALKLASSGGEDARRRARDEGRALARLSHPNVVPIYDVVDHPTGVFLVMELVKGRTLRELATEATAQELVHAYRQAGAGLAAAHEVGLVHRDFKPDNAIMGADERVRVLDFGLAHEVSSEQQNIAGTPRYMAPEQLAGDTISPAVDQYALAVALHECISSRGQVPRWLQSILARGSAEKAADRYPSMDALLGALALDPATRWRRRGIAALAVAIMAAGFGAFLVAQGPSEDSPCEGGPDLIARSWGADQRASITKHLQSLSTPYSSVAAPRITSGLDAYGSDWVRVYKASCHAHRRAEISAALFDRRSGCLSSRRAALGKVVDLAGSTTSEGLPDVVVAVGRLPDVDACDDDAGLMADVEPPSPKAAVEATALADDIARVNVEIDAGRYDDASKHANDVVSRAGALGYRPLIARARYARGRLTQAMLRDDRGADDLRAATYEALVVGDEPLAIEAYGRFAYAVGTTTDREHATDGLRLIEALAEGAGERARFAKVILYRSLGGVALAREDRAQARIEYQRSRNAGAGLQGNGAIEFSTSLRGLVLTTDDDGARATAAAELIAARIALLGERHPLTIEAEMLAGAMNPDRVAARSQLRQPCEETAKYYPAKGEAIGTCGYELAWLAFVAGDRAAVLAAADLVDQAAEHGAEPQHVQLARGYRQLANGDAKAAISTFAEGAQTFEPNAAWWEKEIVAEKAMASAIALAEAGDNERARVAMERATATYDQIAKAMAPPVLARRRQFLNQLAQRLH